MTLLAVSVDLDGIGEYRALHGLGPAPAAADPVYAIGLPRALAWARAEGLPLTLFAIGRDLERAEHGEAIRAAAAGHAVENHSWGHRYDLGRLPRAAIAEEVGRGAEAIRRVTGRAPAGFRAPGYAASDALFEVIAAECRYDASIFPCPSYYAAKALAIAAIAARGKRSASVLDDPRPLLAPRVPHRRRGVLELPMAVTRRLRLPLIGTAIAAAGARLAPLLARGCADLPLVSLELHGIDFLDRHDGLDDVARHQLDLRIDHRAKLAALSAAVRALQGARPVTLPEAAAALGG